MFPCQGSLSESSAHTLLSRCVSAGAVHQEEISSAPWTPVLTCELLQVQQRLTLQRQLEEVQLELLQQEVQRADVTHSFYLASRCAEFQVCSEHLQQLLRDKHSLRQRLIHPLTSDRLQLPAPLHRSVVESLKLILSFIETLEEKISSAHEPASIRERMNLLSGSLAQLLAQASEVETLTNHLLQRSGAL